MTARAGLRPAIWLGVLVALLVLLSAAAVGLLMIRMDRTGELTLVFLNWNLFLAWVPFLAALVLLALHRAEAPVWLLGATGFVWLLFLPNAPYIITDRVHLAWVAGAPRWFDTLLIGAYAAAGLALGLASLLLVHRVVAERRGALAGWALALGSLPLCALGVYLGRYLRFNSWDVLTNPSGLAGVVLARLADPLGNPFLLRFGMSFTAGLVLAYLLAWALGRLTAGPVPARQSRDRWEIRVMSSRS